MNVPTEILTQNISAIVMAGLFLWYIGKRDKLIQSVFNEFSNKLEKLTDAIAKLESRLHHIENIKDKK